MSSAVLTLPSEVRTHTGRDLDAAFQRWDEYLCAKGIFAASRRSAWLAILRDGLGHVPYCLESVREGRTCGLLPLVFVHSWWFGRFLVSLPYLNSAGLV